MYLAWLEDDIENEYVATHVMSDVNQFWIGEFTIICYMNIYFISSPDKKNIAVSFLDQKQHIYQSF